ncbi:FAS1 domain-containing protein [Dioszegia hungarica]|uniref:FAS1 domain-containing protein n=1 Tax=Dioszegia hungarica TaxID=4972 RepID=A0AA38LUL4_9TREE|nr:FAS1 domain-containing protein [Dioszegia hungarica]KAI9635910.1 FAS1 domain-containing protein [Dioszegia hungarica]
MLHNLFLLLPIVAALPARPALPELTVSQWSNIQSGFVNGAKDLGEWSFGKAHEIIDSVQDEIDAVVAHQNSGDETQETIWKKLKDDPHSFSKLTNVIDFVGGTAREILDDGKLQITFFAPNNDALTPPEHHHHHHDDDHAELTALMANPSLATVSSLLDRQPAYLLEDDHRDHHGHHGGDSDEDKKRKREIFKKIAAKVLAYHGLPKAYTASDLAQNSTLETALKAGRGGGGGLYRRIRVEKSLLPPSLKINFYARVLVSDIKAKNGYLHTINRPLLPPGSIFESLYAFPDFFSTVTSAVQGTDGRHYLDYAYDRNASKPGHPEFTGSPLATFFAPTNAAFALLPPKLKFFLFSPFGKRVLAKVLAYHYIPHSLVLSEFQYHEKHEKRSFIEAAEGMFNVADDPSFRQELEVHTGLPNSTLKLVLEKKKVLPIDSAIKTSITVNGHAVETIDVPARNGAFHVINKVLVPPHHHHDDEGNDLSAQDSWANWEQWLPAWAEQA